MSGTVEPAEDRPPSRPPGAGGGRIAARGAGRPPPLVRGGRGWGRLLVGPTVSPLALSNSKLGGWGDAEWPILIHRAGWMLTYVAVDGVEWETPDFHRETVADEATRRSAADAYDLRADRWADRVRVAREIISESLAAIERPST